MRYRRFGGDLLALELVHRTSTNEVLAEDENGITKAEQKASDKLVSQAIIELDTPLVQIIAGTRAGTPTAPGRLNLCEPYGRQGDRMGRRAYVDTSQIPSRLR